MKFRVKRSHMALIFKHKEQDTFPINLFKGDILEFNDDAIEIINDETPLKCEKEVEYSRSGTGRKDFFAGTFKNATENEFKILYAIDELNAKIEELKKKLK